MNTLLKWFEWGSVSDGDKSYTLSSMIARMEMKKFISVISLFEDKTY